MSNTLKSLQQRFQDYLIGHNLDFEQDIISTPNALAEHRLGAYYNAYRIRLINCLATDFPGLVHYLGEQRFEYLVLDYLTAHPSQHPSVRWLGQFMADFIQNATLSNQVQLNSDTERRFSAELAAFEWAQGLCFDAAEAEGVFCIEDMATIAPQDWPNLTFQFAPSLRWLDLHGNIPPWWAAHDNASELPAPAFAEHPTRWLLWRQQTSPHWRSLDVDEAWAIEAAFAGANFGELCEGLLEWIDADSAAMRAATHLKQWVSDEIIVNAICTSKQ